MIMIVVVKSYLQEIDSTSMTEYLIVPRRLAATTHFRVGTKNHEDSRSVPRCPAEKHEKQQAICLDLSATHLAQIRIGRGNADDDGMALRTILGLRGLRGLHKIPPPTSAMC